MMIDAECIMDLLDKLYNYRPKVKFVFRRWLKYPRGSSNVYTKTIYIYLNSDIVRAYEDLIIYLILHELKHLMQVRDKYKGNARRFLNDYRKELSIIDRYGISPEMTPLEYEAMMFGEEESEKEDVRREFMKCFKY